MKTKGPVALALIALLFASGAFAQTLYKLVDKDGKVTYSEKAPKDFPGTVTKIEVNPNANSMDAPRGKGGAAVLEDVRRDREAARDASRTRATEARARLDAARKAYEQARDNPGTDDVRRMGSAGGGSRPVFSEDFQAKLDKLEAEVRAAEEALRRAERD